MKISTNSPKHVKPKIIKNIIALDSLFHATEPNIPHQRQIIGAHTNIRSPSLNHIKLNIIRKLLTRSFKTGIYLTPFPVANLPQCSGGAPRQGATGKSCCLFE